MILSDYYWYFKSAIPPRICDDIIKHGLSKKEEMARTGAFSRKGDLNKDELAVLKKRRNSDVTWLDDTWIYKEIQPYVKLANENAGWNFEWDWSESIQFTKYKLNQYYDWHADSYHKPYNKKNNKNEHGKIRKLSMTLQLTDGSEYEGGELEFDFRNNDDGSNIAHVCEKIRPKGSIVVFPSFVWHRVKPVTSGTRYSLVIWNLGRPYR